MGRLSLAATISVVSILAASTTYSANAQDLVWQVENPFRFFKSTRSFVLHETAYNAVRGSGETPRDVVWRTERRLNDPDCRDSSTPDRCAATAGKRYQQSRVGWANQTLNDTCYDRNGTPRRYFGRCERTYSWGRASEDYVLPEAHTVQIRIAPDRLEGVSGECAWMWRPRRDGGKIETKKQNCANPLTIQRVPYAQDRAVSGVSVAVTLPDGRQFAERDVVVEDVFVVALGDSFASGESNPDRPVQFSPSREMVYDPTLLNDEVANGPDLQDQPPPKGFGLSSREDNINPKVLPRRLMEDELAERFLKQSSTAFKAAFDKAQAHWLSRDCHRSQYGYPIRVAMQLALENRHRSVTLATFTCSGAEIAHGLFLEMDPREGFSEPGGKKVRPQLDQLSELICRGPRTQQATYTLPMYATGSTSISAQRINMSWCPPNQRKRSPDMVLMSIGGNDVGFGGLVAYAMTESAADFAPIATWMGSSIRFGTNVSRAYMDVLDHRMKALKDALQQGFGIEPSRVLQTTYEPIQYDENGQLCGAQPTLGLDVHPGLQLHRGRLQETAVFLDDFMGRLECLATGRSARGCPANLATGASGTGFRLITDHVPEFTRRGMCARDPRRAFADGNAMKMPRRPPGADEFRPYSPAATLPYGRHWRLFRTPNDAFLTAHTHREGVSPFDILQPAYAGLYSGAIHPTAEGHAIVADHVVRHARSLLDRRESNQRAAR
jgi:hypothetical protein